MTAAVRRRVWVVALCSLAACRSGPPARDRRPPPVESFGSMPEQMAAGTPSAGVALSSVLSKPHTFAIGPLAGFQGELLVWDGTAFASRFVGETLHVSIDGAASAAFLIATHAKAWRDFVVPNDVQTFAELSAWLPRLLERAKLAPDRLYALRLFGAVTRATLHVVDFKAGTPLDLDTLAAARRVVELHDVPAQLLGFMAPPGQSTCPLASPPLHLHLRTLLGDVVGHVDDLTLAPGAKIELAWE